MSLAVRRRSGQPPQEFPGVAAIKRAQPPDIGGTRCAIYSIPLRTKACLEGWATPEERVPGIPDLWRVRFEHEPHRLHTRLVHGGVFQRDPDEILRALDLEWRVRNDPALRACLYSGFKTFEG